MKLIRQLIVFIIAIVASFNVHSAVAQTELNADILCNRYCRQKGIPSLYDANGRLVGHVMHAGCLGEMSSESFDKVTVASNISGKWYYVCWSASGLEGSGYVFFATNDCSGTPYFSPTNPSQLFQVSKVANVGGSIQLLEPDYSMSVQSITVQSIQPISGPCQASSGTYELQAMKLGPSFSTIFTGPFRIQ